MKVLLFPFILLLGIFVSIIVTILAAIALPILLCVGFYENRIVDYFDDWKEVFVYLYYVIFANVFNFIKHTN